MYDQPQTSRPTLHAKRDHGTRPGQPAARKQPFIAKGHDAILKRLQDSKTETEVTLISGVQFVGTIEARDKFTITLRVTKEDVNTTIYKHAIEAFKPVANVAAMEE